MSALFGSWASMQDIQTLNDILDHFAVPERVWRAFELQVGSPGADLRLLAALPKVALITGCGQAQTDEGILTPIQATQVGLVWRLARRVVAAQSGVSEEQFIDVDPWMEAVNEAAGGGPQGDTGRPEPLGRSGGGVKERVRKMNSLIDQYDESELLPPAAMDVDRWYQNYVTVMGSQPDEAEEPRSAQLAAPYTDFSLWTPLIPTKGFARTSESQCLEGIVERFQGGMLDAEHLQFGVYGGVFKTD